MTVHTAPAPLPAPAPTSAPAPTVPLVYDYRCLRSPFGAHRWEIEPPCGPVSSGYCCYCGEVRQFVNYVEIRFKDGSKELSAIPIPLSVNDIKEIENIE